MYIPQSTTKFKKDIELMRKQGKDMKRLVYVMHDLAAGKMLSPHHRDHKLAGEFAHHR